VEKDPLNFNRPEKLCEWPLGVYQIETPIDGFIGMFRLLPNRHFQGFNPTTLQWNQAFQYDTVAIIPHRYIYLGDL
jgi:hypothetical protein